MLRTLHKMAAGSFGTFVDPTTYNPGGTAGTIAGLAIDLTTGALLVSMRSLSPATDGIRAHTPEPTMDTFVGPITTTSTTFVNSEHIDCSDYDRIAVHPNKTTGSGAGNAEYRLQWSLDATNWFDGIIMVPSTGAMVVVPDVVVTTAVAAGYQPAAVIIQQKLARYCRVSQQSLTAATHTVEYHYQLL